MRTSRALVPSLIWRKKAMRRAAATLLVPVTLLFGYGPTAASVHGAETQRRARLEALAHRQGLDPQMLIDPEGWQRRHDGDARKRRAAALAGLPHESTPAWLDDAVASTRRAQALHTAVAASREIAAGQTVDLDRYPPEVRSLLDGARRARVRAPAKPRPMPERHVVSDLRAPARAQAIAPTGRRAAQGTGQTGLRRVLDAVGASPLPTVAKAVVLAPLVLSEWLGLGDGLSGAGVSVLGLTVPGSTGGDASADRAASPEAQSTDPEIVAKAAALGNDPVRLYAFVRDGIATELYFGSKKGALGTLREGAGNDFDQASLLVALLRAAGFAAHYQVGDVFMNAAQAADYTGTLDITTAASLLSSAGFPASIQPGNAGEGNGVRVQHTWVQAYLPALAYRGVARPGAGTATWVDLSPSIKAHKPSHPVDLRDAAAFDFDGFLLHQSAQRPSEVYQGQLRDYVQAHGIDCDTLDAAQPGRAIAAGNAPHLPADLPVRRVGAPVAELAAADAAYTHTATLTATTSLGAVQWSYTAPVASLWGKTVSVVYEPASAADAATIASYGGLEQTPAYAVDVRAVLKLDGVAVATGLPEHPGLDQDVVVDTHSPATGLSRVDHAVKSGGVYAILLDPGLPPEDLLTAHEKRFATLVGDDLQAERLYVEALRYMRELGGARQTVAGLAWHRLYKEVEEVMTSVDLSVDTYLGTPLAIHRVFAVTDAAGIRSGNFSVDGDHHRRAQIARLVGFESSYLEHRLGEMYRGARHFSAVKLVQVAHEGGVPVLNIGAGNLDESLLSMAWPEDFQDKIRDAVNVGQYVLAPQFGHTEAGLGNLYGFIATDPTTGAGAYIVAFESGVHHALVNGGVGDDGSAPSAAGGDGPPGGCPTCGGAGPIGSMVDFLSGNYFERTTELTLPARGLPLSFTWTYSSFFGWKHNYGRRITANGDGSLTYLDESGVPHPFTPDGLGTSWLPPPLYFQRIVPKPDGYEMQFPDGMVTRFDSAGRLAYEADLNGHVLTYTYDVSGRLTRVEGAGGGAFTFAYDGAGNLASVTDNSGGGTGPNRQATFEWTGGHLTADHDVLGKIRSYTYDAAGRMHTKTDRRGHVSTVTYDDVGRVVRVDGPEGRTRQAAYDTRNLRTVLTDALGNATLYELATFGSPTRIVDALGDETVRSYDARGNMLAEQDPRGHLTTSSYDADGDLLSRTDATGATTTYAYGAHARLESTTDAAGKSTSNVYDGNGNLLSTTDALGHTTTYSYADGLPTSITRPGGSTTAMSYDAAGNVVSMTDATGGLTTMAYDGAGHLTSMQDPNLHSRAMTVDARGQLLTTQDALGNSSAFTYDDDGNRLTATDPAAQATTFVYDGLGRLTSTTDALGDVTRQEYDAEGRVTARVDARGFRTIMAYDELGRLVSSTDALGNSTTMAYCAGEAQQPCATVDALGNVTTTVEDVLGREVERHDALGNVTRTEYDLLGRRTAVTDPAGAVTRFAYDDVGRLTGVTDAKHGVTGYGYDARGNRTSVTDGNGHVTTFAYDLANRLIGESNPIGDVTGYGYDAAGNRTGKLDGKGQTTTFTYDADRRLTDIAYDGGVTPAHFDYDERGNKTLERNGDSERHMSYDALGRLTHVEDVTVGHDLDYGYDAGGNRASMTVTPENETTGYVWDARGLLSRMTDPEGGQYHFAYDADGRRVAQTYPNGMVLHNTYDEASRITSMVYRNAGGDVIESFTYTYDSRGNRLSKIFADGTAEVYGYDELSRLVRAGYPSGREVDYQYDAVGNRLAMTEGQQQSAAAAAATCPGDADCDGVLDAVDNCRTVWNPTQTDSDATGVPAGMAAGYRFEDAMSSLTAVDVMGGSPGHYTGAGKVSGEFGQATHTGQPSGGTFAEVQVPATSATSFTGAQFSVAAWIKPDSESQDGTIVSKPGQVTFTYKAGQSLFFQDASGFFQTAAIGAAWHTGAWNHVAATTDGTSLRVYANGTLVVTRAFAEGGRPVANVPLHIGCGAPNNVLTATTCSASDFKGAIDEVALWKRTLSGPEVATLAGRSLAQGDGIGDACDPCPGSTDVTCAPTTCLDEDGDGYGVQGASACAGGGGVAAFDCAPDDPTVHPGAPEVCDGKDNDCNGRVDDGCLQGSVTTRYAYNAFNQLLTSSRAPVCAAGDADCDGVPDATDNCPGVFNPTQANRDATVTSPTPALGKWSFNEGSGTVAHDSVGGRDATLVGGATWAAGRSGAGTALKLVQGQWGEISHTLGDGMTQGVTIEAWVKSDAIGASDKRAVFMDPAEYDFTVKFGLYLDGASSNLTAGFWNGPWHQVSEPTPFPTLSWQHVAGSYDGQKLRVYRNGVKVAEATDATGLPSTDADPAWRIGRSWYGDPANGHWNGMVDDLAVYGAALSDNEIRIHAGAADSLGDACDPCPDNPDPSCAPATCVDADGDGYGPQGASNCGGHPGVFDCNDGNAGVHPGVTDVCDGVDNDCDGVTDEDCAATSYAYDRNGNQTGKVEPSGATTYTYDARDRMVGVAGVGGSATYAYDTQNLRVRMTDSGGDKRVLLDGIEEAAELEAGSGERTARYDHDPARVDALLAQSAGAGKVEAYTDALGSVYGLLDGTGAQKARYRYDVYGARIASLETVGTGWGFTGRRGDGRAGLPMHYRMRGYDSATGRFVQDDPAGFVDGPNLYGYVANEPTGLRDPLGLSIEVWAEPLDLSGAGRGVLSTLAFLTLSLVGAYPRHTFVVVSCAAGCSSDFPAWARPVAQPHRMEIGGPISSDGRATPYFTPWDFSSTLGGFSPAKNYFGNYLPVPTDLSPDTSAPGRSGCAKEACLVRNFAVLGAHLPKYNPVGGPNSNTFAFRLLLSCGIYAFMPSTAYGWDSGL